MRTPAPRAAAIVTAAAVVLATREVSAAPDGDASEGDPAFRYDKPAERQYVRAALEELALLGLGELHYAFNQDSNSPDFDLDYDWPSFRSKLTLSSVAFDTNRFPTNWVTHPAAGWLYYSAARSNRLTIAESFLFSFAASTIWEYVGELREQVSVNDEIATTVGGAVLGESTMQLGAFFRRSRRTPTTTALAWLFSAPKQVHDAIDGVDTPTALELDELGFPAEEWHRFRVVGGAGVTHQDRGVTQSDGRVSISSELIALAGYERPGRGNTGFESGEVSTLAFDVATGGSALVDLRFRSTVMPAGLYARDLRVGDAGRMVGHGLLVGMSAGLEYGVHEYDRDGRHPMDEIALVDAGAKAAHAWHAGPLVLRSSLAALVDFAGVASYALPRYLGGGGTKEPLPIVAAQYGYYHAVGGTLHPTIGVEVGSLDVGGDLRVDVFGAITALERKSVPGVETPTIRDRRLEMRAWIGASPAPWLRLSISAERRVRAGRVGTVTDSRGETAAFGNVELRF